MKRKPILMPVKLFLLLFLITGMNACQKPQPVNWPAVTNQTQPWTRWWWHGSAVTTEGLTTNMEQLKEAGFGGLEITPIYGVKGYESQSLSFESPEWMKAFEYTLKEGRRLGLGIDLANASGWPFGANWVQAGDACKNVQYKQYSLKTGERLKEKIEFIQEPMVRAVGHHVDISEVKLPVSSNTNLQELALDQIRFKKPLPLQALMAYSDKGETIDLTGKVNSEGMLDWTAPDGNWTLYAVFQGWHGKMVERAGKGGEGNVIDHFSKKAIHNFLSVFDEGAKNMDMTGLRAFFNDSYEVDDAQGESDWTPLLLDEFKARRGYDLKQYLPALFGNDSEEINNRVLCDFRETISDLLLDNFTKEWADWAKSHQAVIRNQAHGSPANILDLYEASDIPETEGTNPMRIKMATSAGHVSGKPLIACEAATWLDEHFLATLSAAKQNFDRYLANGVNHIVYHGTPYSPADEKWPGWLFYAAVHFAPTNSWWDDLKAVNEYVTRCQSFMQNSVPDNDILLYFPIYDTWSEKGRSILPHFGGSKEELTKELSEMLLSKGYTFDYISDRQIKKLQADGNQIKSEGASYKTILVPKCKYIPLETMQKLAKLANAGATVIFQDDLPAGVPGLADLKNRQQAYQTLIQSFQFTADGKCKQAKGQLLKGNDVEKMITTAGVTPEEMAGPGLWFNRVTRTEGTCYFISNWSGQKIDQWITVNSSGKQAVWFNPMNGKIGKAQTKKSGNGQSEIYLQLEAGETLILQWYPYKSSINDYPLWTIPDEKTALSGEWTVSFLKGGPTIPASYKTSELKSWTEKSDELKKFSGTASYQISFKKPADNAPAYQLDLGKVAVSATVFLNGENAGTLVGPVYQLVIDSSLLKGNNELEVRVSNRMANRVIDMDKNGENYKKFYNINFAAHERKNRGNEGLFTAAGWEPLESGLMGPVYFSPVERMKGRE